MSPVELPYVPILLNETFMEVLWDTGAEKSFISKETYRKYFFYKQVKKSRTQVITAHEAKCQNLGVVELNIRIREFKKPWLFHVMADLEYPCILGIDFISGSKIILDFDRRLLAIPDSQIDKVVKTIEEGKLEIDLSKTKLEEKQKQELQDLFNSFQELFSDKPGLIHVLYDIDTGDNPPVVSGSYRYDRLDNPEAYRFAVDNRKLNAITKYPLYPLPLIDDLIMNIPHTAVMSTLDLTSGYFQMAVNPSDIVKTTFVRKNDTYVFRRMHLASHVADPNFQTATDIVLKPVIGKFKNVYMDDVILSSPSFTQHIEHLKEVFRLLQDAGLIFTRINANLVVMNKRISQWYAKFIKNYADLCEPLYNLKRKLKKFCWSIEAQKAFDAVKVAITRAPVLKLPDFKKPFELFADASSIDVGAVLNQEQRPVVFASRTLSGVERNYTVTERECLAVVWALNKFRTYLGSVPIKLIEEQRTDPELGHIYRYLENPEDSPVNSAICENWSNYFKLIEGLLSCEKYATSLGEMRIYIPKPLRNEIMR
ncbi:retrovirus-related Pol polyprotein from transposon 297 [Trichonephila clavipes]|nr:retrovirus-related Pol polyprotein from transposon 297 [Trichonephila clavipes]